MLKIALIGSIGSGKSTFGSHLASMGGYVVEVDDLLRDLLRYDKHLNSEIKVEFGENLFENQIFSEQKSKAFFEKNLKSLEQFHKIVSPYIEKSATEKCVYANSIKAPYFVLVTPEISARNFFGIKVFDYVIQVDCLIDEQFTRLKKRSNKADDLITYLIGHNSKIQHSQPKIDCRINNNHDLNQLKSNARFLHNTLLKTSPNFLSQVLKFIFLGGIFCSTLAGAQSIYPSCLLAGTCLITSNQSSTVSSSSNNQTFNVLSSVSVSTSSNSPAFNLSNNGTSLINNGAISTTGTGSSSSYAAIYSPGSTFTSLGSITNNGQITNTRTGGSNAPGINLWGTSGVSPGSGSLDSLVNNASGQIYTSNGNGILLHSNGVITTLTNFGTIATGGNATSYFGISNTGTISTLNNAQGVGNSYGALTYSGALPSNYNIIISGANNYGQLSVANATGNSVFGIYSGSTVAAGTYADVLQGFSSLSSVGGTNGIYSGFNYSLIADSAHSGMWSLVLTAASTNILSGATNLLSGVGSSLNPVFDGGILKIDSAGTSAVAFTITSNNGKIDQNSLTSNFTGNITNSGAGINGKLTIINGGSGGSVILSGNNTYSGGTEVDAGANLSISSANNIGTGALALVGTSTTPATLTTTASMTIANPITVTADPVFSVASGTTTTVSSPITDGSSAGDVVVSGGGTLALTAVNTYTGTTSIGSGSTLALTGSGSIATSSGVSNNGTFNIAGKTSNVTVANYTQGSTGNLAMSFAPSSNQQLNVTGTTSLAGTLALTATAGSYVAGRYTILTSANGVTGTFGGLTSNLASYTGLSYRLSYDADDVYLNLLTNGPSTANTQASLQNTAQALQGTYTLQNSVLANSFSYDCNEFGENDVCISAGGRNTAVSAANGLNNTSALLIAAYRAMPNVRVGAYADQNLSMNQAGNTVNLGNNTPLIGLFGAWNENTDGTGTEVKVAAAYGQKNASVTRQVVGTGSTASEAGNGSAPINSQGAQITAKYGFGVAENVIVSPYIGMRYTQNNMNGYTEGASATVTAPLTYSALNTNATTVLAGVGASYRFIPQAGIFASAGVETDTNTANGTYSATGVAGLSPINFNANPVKTRPTAMLGAYYDIEAHQRLGITGIYRQEAYQAVQTITVMATYTVGF